MIPSTYQKCWEQILLQKHAQIYVVKVKFFLSMPNVKIFLITIKIWKKVKFKSNLNSNYANH